MIRRVFEWEVPAKKRELGYYWNRLGTCKKE